MISISFHFVARRSKLVCYTAILPVYLVGACTYRSPSRHLLFSGQLPRAGLEEYACGFMKMEYALTYTSVAYGPVMTVIVDSSTLSSARKKAEVVPKP